MFFINPFIYEGAGGDFESIATVTVGSGGSSTITFTNIPQTYQHLQVRVVSRSNQSSVLQSTWRLSFNSDTNANYAYHRLSANGATTSASSGADQSFILNQLGVGTDAATSVFGAAIFDILDYTNTTKNTTLRAFGGVDSNGSGWVEMNSGLYMQPDAITAFEIKQQTGSFVQHTTAALYGIKAP